MPEARNGRGGRRGGWGTAALVAWLCVRLPLAALALLYFREAIVRAVERRFGLSWPTELVILFVASARERALLFAACAALLAVGWLALARGVSSAALSRALHAAFSLALLLALFRWCGGSLSGADAAVAAGLTALFALNLRGGERSAPEARAPSRLADALVAAAVGVELVLPGPVLGWLARRLGDGHAALRVARRAVPVWLPAALVTAGGAALYLSHVAWSAPRPEHPPGLRALHAALYADASVERLAEGDFHAIELDAARTTLYATGHGLRRLRAFDLAAPGAPPRLSPEPTGMAQDFAYDPAAGELYVYMPGPRALVVLDAATLERRRSFPLPGIAPGDATVHWDAASGVVFVLSEADRPGDYAFAALDGRSGRVVQRLPIAADSGGLLDPGRERLYMISFRRRELVVYDTRRREIVREVETDARVNGLALDPAADELLVASPLRSRVRRYAAASLERVGAIDTVFGVRYLAVDAKRNLLLCASLATNRLDVIDLSSRRSVARYRVAPWLRQVAPDVERGVAYVSSKFGLFAVRYTERLPAALR